MFKLASFPRVRASHVAPFFLIPAVIAVLSSCGADRIVPPCPPVRIDDATSILTKFKDGAPQEPGNVEYRIELVGYKGQCKFPKTVDKVDVAMDIDFTLEPGPAAQPGPVKLYYFVAIPQFFPRPEGKRIMEIDRLLTKGQGERIRESNVHVVIPLKKEEITGNFEPPATYDIYLGLQLDQQQLDYNRAHPVR